MDEPIARTHGRGARVTLDLRAPHTIDRVTLVEDTRRGANVQAYVVEGLAFDEWRELAHGTEIGEEARHSFEPAAVLKVRLRVTRAAAKPVIRELAVYSAGGGGAP